MTIRVDSKANDISSLFPDEVSKEETLLEPGNAPDPMNVVSEMETLFSGMRRIEALKTDHPDEPIIVPDLKYDLLDPLPALGGSSIAFDGIIEKYQILRSNIIERRNSYSHTLESFLKPEEAFDIARRIEDLDLALNQIDENLDQAYQMFAAQKALEIQRANQSNED